VNKYQVFLTGFNIVSWHQKHKKVSSTIFGCIQLNTLWTKGCYRKRSVLWLKVKPNKIWHNNHNSQMVQIDLLVALVHGCINLTLLKTWILILKWRRKNYFLNIAIYKIIVEEICSTVKNWVITQKQKKSLWLQQEKMQPLSQTWLHNTLVASSY